MKCVPFGDGVISFPDEISVTVTDRNGKVWVFDFEEHTGPMVVNRNGDPVKQPGERSPFWPAFEKWFGARQARRRAR